MISFRPDAIIFDLDGTLLDTIDDIAMSANATLEAHGYPPHAVSVYKELVGDGLKNLARKVLPAERRSEDDIARFCEEYRPRYAAGWKRYSRPYDGIQELLATLQDTTIPLAVLSNKRDEDTKICVEAFFPTVRFAEVRGERSGTPIKPHPQAALEIAHSLRATPTRCLFVGDSEIDIRTAHAASMTSVGVTWGFRSRSLLEEERAAHIISAPSELLDVCALR